MIYVDNVNIKWGKYIMCHMLSDKSITELIGFGEKIGLKQDWVQELNGIPYFDVSTSKRDLAIKNGAVEIDLLTGTGTDKLAEIVRFWVYKKTEKTK